MCREAYPEKASSGLEAVGSAAVEALWSPGKVVDHLVLVREFSPEDVVERLQAGA